MYIVAVQYGIEGELLDWSHNTLALESSHPRSLLRGHQTLNTDLDVQVTIYRSPDLYWTEVPVWPSQYVIS
jgi:hypothetical protein